MHAFRLVLARKTVCFMAIHKGCRLQLPKNARVRALADKLLSKRLICCYQRIHIIGICPDKGLDRILKG